MSLSEEKAGVHEIERVDSSESKLNDARIDTFTPEEQKKIIRKVDLRHWRALQHHRLAVLHYIRCSAASCNRCTSQARSPHLPPNNRHHLGSSNDW
jgi:hypothetical protein